MSNNQEDRSRLVSMIIDCLKLELQTGSEIDQEMKESAENVMMQSVFLTPDQSAVIGRILNINDLRKISEKLDRLERNKDNKL